GLGFPLNFLQVYQFRDLWMNKNVMTPARPPKRWPMSRRPNDSGSKRLAPKGKRFPNPDTARRFTNSRLSHASLRELTMISTTNPTIVLE
ncbi:MAG TPA: hypothetical protein VD861_04935, partial [Pyrinomonadaceae bacterium]|nr:hypothetical protein [Pyrinomonadaceae bacterium]